MARRGRIWSSLACTAYRIRIFQGVMFNSHHFLLNKKGYRRVVSFKCNAQLRELHLVHEWSHGVLAPAGTGTIGGRFGS